MFNYLIAQTTDKTVTDLVNFFVNEQLLTKELFAKTVNDKGLLISKKTPSRYLTES